MMDEVYNEDQKIRYIGDRSNANSDSTLVSTQRSLCYNSLNTKLYEKFFCTKEELQAQRDGYIYIHDRSARRDTWNCCLFRMGEVLKGGFEMGNVWYNEPKTLDTAFDVMGDVILMAAAQQYGGFTVPEIDKVLGPYAEKSFQKYLEEYKDIYEEIESGYVDAPPSQALDIDKCAEAYAYRKVKREMEQGYQGILEHLSWRKWRQKRFWKSMQKGRVRKASKSRYCSRNLSSCMIKNCMVPAVSTRMSLKPASIVLQKPCIRTGFP